MCILCIILRIALNFHSIRKEYERRVVLSKLMKFLLANTFLVCALILVLNDFSVLWDHTKLLIDKSSTYFPQSPIPWGPWLFISVQCISNISFLFKSYAGLDFIKIEYKKNSWDLAIGRFFSSRMKSQNIQILYVILFCLQ